MSQSNITIDKETSYRINSIRFFMVILVIFGHASSNVGSSIAMSIAGSLAHYSVVPVFFMFSAFLLFLKEYKYKSLLQKKFVTLFIPLLLWPLINLCCYALTKTAITALLPGKDIMQNAELKFWKFSPKEWEMVFFGYGTTFNTPYLSQFWFVRDLIILTIFAPLIELACKKIPHIVLYVTLFIYISGIPIYIMDTQSLCFFVIGYFWAKGKFDLFKFVDSFKWKHILPMWIFSFTIAYIVKFPNMETTKRIHGLLMCIIFLKFSKTVVYNTTLCKISKVLTPYTFFVFAAHQPFLLKNIKIFWDLVLPTSSEFLLFVEFLGVSIITALISLLLAMFTMKFLPHLFSILCGGRTKKKKLPVQETANVS